MPVNNVLLSAVDLGRARRVHDVRHHGPLRRRFERAGARWRRRSPGMIGVHGKVSGFITVNMTDRIAVRAVDGLLQEKFNELNSQVVDATGEITNMVVGGIKSALATTQWAFSQITVPSVIVGQGYSIAYARGLEFLNVIFEHDDKDAVLLEDRLIQVSISLLTL